jgi:hypothetical protein
VNNQCVPTCKNEPSWCGHGTCYKDSLGDKRCL